ncbi:hypothetical protein OEZ85_009799 [Tetradesmus obliquus]|uniref:Bowman-Birk serine protease inhibitors family domain-containing protein n=2 Tax=Tetradesmus obliquus TaxID=3088 RepID=A0A383WGC0_TETOB|nr:hypothetical protein OEZ85_009799 [Tetradesmus obliquus]|eukprot:jgi/Sobl393_1/11324/SZX76313.1
MAKSAVVALVLCALLASAFAAETGRNLQQAGNIKITYDCNGAKQMGTVKNACSLLCTCAGSMNRAFNTPAMKTQCQNMCNACQTAAKTCAPGSPLPQACRAGQGIKEVNTCITAFLRAQGK